MSWSFRGLDLPPPTLRQSLDGSKVPDLRAWAARIVKRPPQRKGELLDLLERHLSDPDNLRAILAALDPVEQAAVAEAVHGGGRVDLSSFRAKYGRAPTRAGWLGPFFDSHLRLPVDLRERLRPLVPAPAEADLASSAELPAGEWETAGGAGEAGIVRLTEHAAQADVLAVLRLCETGRLRCGETTRRPTAATVRAVAEVLEEGDFYAGEPIAAFAWPLLLQAGGLAELAGGRLQLTARGRRALAAPAHATLRHLWQRWLSHGPIDEFSRVEAIKGQQASGGRNLTAVPLRRDAVAGALADAPPRRWVDVDDFFTYMQASEQGFDVVRDPWRLYLGDPEYGSFGYDGFGGWDVVQGRYVLCLLFEYAATLGLLDVAYGDAEGARDDYRDQWGADDLEALSRYDGLRFFRVNALGAHCLGRETEYRPEAAPLAPARPRVRVLPNLEVVCLGRRLPAAEALLLERYAEPRSERTWALDRRRLLAAIDHGHGADELERFLRERAEPPLPQEVLQWIGEARERAGRLTDLGTVRLVACADADVARLLAHHRRLRAHCSLVGNTHLAVPVEREDRFRRALWEVGYALPPGSAAAVERA